MLTTTIMKIWTLYLLVKTLILNASLLPKRRLNNGTKSKHLKGHSGPRVGCGLLLAVCVLVYCFETVKHFILIKYHVCISLFGSLTFGNLLMVA